MKKTDKKIENAIVKALNIVCETALEEIAGFKWITHLVRYSDFPGSLSIVCIFDARSNLADAMVAQKDEYLRGLIKEQLQAAGVQVRDVERRVSFDTEEACSSENEGRWHERLG